MLLGPVFITCSKSESLLCSWFLKISRNVVEHSKIKPNQRCLMIFFVLCCKMQRRVARWIFSIQDSTLILWVQPMRIYYRTSNLSFRMARWRALWDLWPFTLRSWIHSRQDLRHSITRYASPFTKRTGKGVTPSLPLTRTSPGSNQRSHVMNSLWSFPAARCNDWSRLCSAFLQTMA